MRNDGYSDAFIDEWIQVDDGLPLEVALELITSECDLKLLLIRHIQHLRDQLSNGDQTPMDWIWDGYLLSWFQFMGSLNESEELWFSELQRARQKGTRNRTTLAKMAIEYILQVAPIDTMQERGRDIERFRNFVDGQPCITVNGITIEITPVAVTRRKDIIGYVFENLSLPSNETQDMATTPMSTIYSIIFRLNNKLSEKNK